MEDWPNAKRRQYETVVGRVEREGKWVVTIGFQRRSEDIECNHDFDTHEAMANVLGSR